MITRRTLLGTALLTPFCAWSAVTQADIYVSTVGRDVWSGRLAAPAPGGADGPLATLHEAKKRIAELRRRQPDREQPVVIALRGGAYFCDEPIRFGPEDSGTETSPNIFQAFGDERPVLSGGVPISRWQVTTEGHWQTTLDDVQAGKWSFAQLFVDDQRRGRPRLPENGYYRATGRSERSQFGFAGDEIRADWANLGDVEVLLFHEWSASRMRIASVIPTESRAVLNGSTWEPPGEGHRFQVDNVREALSKPGQWYLDRPLGKLTYLPRPDEQPDRTVVIAPRLEEVLVIHGDPINRHWVHHIQFRGLSFAHTNWTLPFAGQSLAQAEIGLGAAIAVIGGRQISFESCAVRHVGGYGVAFGSGSRDNRLESCELVDLAGGGVKIGHAGSATWDSVEEQSGDPEMHVSHHVVRNCLIAHGGRLHPAGVGVWIGQSSHNTIEHNEIYDFYQTGISVGWTWGYGHSDAHHNDIAFNHVHTIGQNVMSDMGGIYTLGIQPGTIVHDNHVHDIQSFDYGGWGLYADEGSSNIVMERNLVHHAKTGGFYQHYGSENRILNNIFAFATQFQLEAPKPEPHVSFHFERNVIYWDNGSPLVAECEAGCQINFKADYNVYWNAVAPAVFPGNVDLDRWREESEQDAHSLVADPLFEDASNRDFRLRPGSPALAMGFQPLEMARVGRQAPPVLTRDLPGVPPAFP